MELLRIIFTFVIVFYHMRNRIKIFSQGRYAVELFFILSGFFFALTYERTPTIIDFIKRKIIRFTPLIVFCSLFGVFFRNKASFSALSADWFFWGNTLFNGDSYSGAAWYISVLIWITLLFYYLLKTQRKETACTVIAVLTFFAYLACVRFGWGRLQGLGDKENLGYLIPQSLMRGIGGIGLGFFIALFYSEKDMKISLFKPWQYTLAELALLILPCVSMFYKPMFPDNVMVLIADFAGLIYLFAVKKGYVSRFLEKPCFARISRYCLAIYLSHQTIAFPILDRLKISSFFTSRPAIAFIYIASSFIVGFTIYHTVERPIGQALKKRLMPPTTDNDKNSTQTVPANGQLTPDK